MGTDKTATELQRVSNLQSSYEHIKQAAREERFGVRKVLWLTRAQPSWAGMFFAATAHTSLVDGSSHAADALGLPVPQPSAETNMMTHTGIAKPHAWLCLREPSCAVADSTASGNQEMSHEEWVFRTTK